MWTAEIIKARFIEAADVERRILVKGMPRSGNAWPSYRFDEDDMMGWDDQAKLDHLEIWQAMKSAASGEVSRWEETYYLWTLRDVPEDRRLLVWTWARCAPHGTFSKACKKRRWVRITAYKRLERVFEQLSGVFRNDGRLLRQAHPKFDIQDTAISPYQNHIIADSAGPDRKPDHPPFRAEKHQDMLTTPAAVAAFSQHLAESNEKRRKARLRKALRGVPGEQEAA